MNHEKDINEFLDRGVEHIYPSREFLKEKLASGAHLTMYHGIDPTGPTLHIGHSVPLLKLAQLQELGHRIILLIGDFTAMIGDPTDKMAARVPLSKRQVLDNAKQYKKQISHLINFGGKNPATLRYNSEWLDTMSGAEMLQLFSHITYAQTIKRDMFQKRIAEDKDLYAHEFMYPALQGYDSVALDVDGEVGGNDQTFNMLMGRDLMRKLKNKEKFVISTKLLVDPSGKKMGKTEGNMVALDEKPEEMFGKIMSWSDVMIVPALELCTRLPVADVAKAKTDLEAGANPRDLKLKLAETVVALYHGETKAHAAREGFLSTFSGGKIPPDLPELKTASGAFLGDCLLSAGLVSSKTDWRRLVGEGAVSMLSESGAPTKILDASFKVESPAVFKVGKHRFLKISLS